MRVKRPHIDNDPPAESFGPMIFKIDIRPAIFPVRMLWASHAVNKSIAISLGCSLAALVTTGEAASVGSDGGLSKDPFLLYPPADLRCPPAHLLCPPADLLYPPSDARPALPTVPSPRSEFKRTPPAISGTPAKELYGKSIVVSWFESRFLDERRGALQSRTITMYVSTLGRTFTKMLVVLGNLRGGLESAGYHRNASTSTGRVNAKRGEQ
jgi:hypothetical protein